MFNIRYFAPHPRLRHLIRNYYLFDVHTDASTVLTDRLVTEFANLRVTVGGNWEATTKGDGTFIAPKISLAGPNSHPTLITGTGSFRMFGMGIQPLGWTALMDAPASELAEHVIAASDMIGAEKADKIAQLVETSTSDDQLVNSVEAGIMCMLQQRSARLSPIVRAVQDLLAVQPVNRVDDLGVRVETSPRQLERLTKEAFGFSPKTTLRRARIRRTIQAMKGYIPVDWESQAEQDFADQSHLIHEFRRFTGLTPSAYQSQTNPLMDVGHAMQAALHRKMRQPQNPDVRLKVDMLLDSAGSAVRALAEAA
jgi:AraC-like DNA-binding protein